MQIILLIILALAGLMSSAVTQAQSKRIIQKSNFSRLSATCFAAHPKNPVIKSGDFFSGSTWNDPSIVKVGKQYIMYASSDLNFNRDVKIYRLVSADGLKWKLSPKTPVLEKDPNSWDSEAVETPSVVFFKGKYHLFYTGYTNQSEPTSYNIGHATSADGIVWKRDPGFRLQPTSPRTSPNLDFRQYIVAEPGAAVFKDKLYLYFTALGANIEVNTTLQVIGVTTSGNGHSWTTPVAALSPNQQIFPRASRGKNFKGFSTPQPIVLNGRMHLYVDIIEELGGDSNNAKQTAIQHAVSPNGISDWKQDSNTMFSRQDFKWTADEIRSPTLWLDGNKLRMWFAGHAGLKLGIGEASCNL